MWYVKERRVRWSVAALLAALAAGATPAHAQSVAAPPGWHAILSRPGDYAVGTEPTRRPDGKGWVGATVRATTADPDGDGILQQSVRADQYRGRRVRLTGWVRTEMGALSGQGRLWVRVDGTPGTLTSDYMMARPITGTRGWSEYAVVVDVPTDAVGITFGFALTGPGQLWLDDLRLDVVGTEVAVTGQPGHETYGGRTQTGLPPAALAALRRAQLRSYELAPLRPVNLDFEQLGVVAALGGR